MKTVEIYWNDLTKEKQQEINRVIGDDHNYDTFPIATIEFEDDNDIEITEGYSVKNLKDEKDFDDIEIDLDIDIKSNKINFDYHTSLLSVNISGDNTSGIEEKMALSELPSAVLNYITNYLDNRKSK